MQARLYTFLSSKTELSHFCRIYFQCYRRGIIEPGIGPTVGGDTFHSAAKSSLLHDSWHRHWSGVSESRLELSRICGRANSEKVGCSYMSFFSPFWIRISNCYEMKLYYFDLYVERGTRHLLSVAF